MDSTYIWPSMRINILFLWRLAVWLSSNISCWKDVSGRHRLWLSSCRMNATCTQKRFFIPSDFAWKVGWNKEWKKHDASVLPSLKWQGKDSLLQVFQYLALCEIDSGKGFITVERSLCKLRITLAKKDNWENRIITNTLLWIIASEVLNVKLTILKILKEKNVVQWKPVLLL